MSLNNYFKLIQNISIFGIFSHISLRVRDYVHDAYRQIFKHFFRDGNRDDILGFGTVCNFQTCFVQKNFLNKKRRKRPYGLDFNFAMGIPYDFFTCPFKPYTYFNFTYATTVALYILLFLSTIGAYSFFISKSAAYTFSVILLALFYFANPNFWRSVSSIMLYIFSTLPALFAIICISSEYPLFAPFLHFMTYLIWTSSGLILFIPLCIASFAYLEIQEFIIYWAITGTLIAPLFLANYFHHKRSGYRRIINGLKLQKRSSNITKSVIYLLGAGVFAYEVGVTPVTISLAVLSIFIFVDSHYLHLFNANYWASICDMIFIAVFASNPSLLLFIVCILVWLRPFVGNSQIIKSAFGANLKPIIVEQDFKKNIKKLFINLDAHHRVAMEIIDTRSEALPYYARLTHRLLSNIQMVHILTSDKPIEFLYGIGSWEQEFSIYSKIARRFSLENNIDSHHQAIKNGCATHVLSISNEYRDQLIAWGFPLTGEAVTLNVPESGQITLAMHVLHDTPFQVSPPVEQLHWGDNELTMTVETGVTYHIGYAWLPGWRATIEGQPVDILDASPGMVINANRSGKLWLRHTFFNHLRYHEPIPYRG